MTSGLFYNKIFSNVPSSDYGCIFTFVGRQHYSGSRNCHRFRIWRCHSPRYFEAQLFENQFYNRKWMNYHHEFYFYKLFIIILKLSLFKIFCHSLSFLKFLPYEWSLYVLPFRKRHRSQKSNMIGIKRKLMSSSPSSWRMPPRIT